MFWIPAPATPQAPAVAETVPSAATWRQRVLEPPAEETMRLVVEAVLKVCVPVHTFAVVVPNASAKCEPEVPSPVSG